eukprot:Skav220349  [mRNA]  locus=scaffold4342:1228:1728:+ [translate_table: standard]
MSNKNQVSKQSLPRGRVRRSIRKPAAAHVGGLPKASSSFGLFLKDQCASVRRSAELPWKDPQALMQQMALMWKLLPAASKEAYTRESQRQYAEQKAIQEMANLTQAALQTGLGESNPEWSRMPSEDFNGSTNRAAPKNLKTELVQNSKVAGDISQVKGVYFLLLMF